VERQRGLLRPVRLSSALARITRKEVGDIRDEWHDVHYRWWVITLSGVLFFFFLSYSFYTQLGWVADQRILPKGSDWVLRHLPLVNVLPVLSWGWFTLHLYAAWVAITRYPKRMPFLMFMLGLYMIVRTLFIFLSPIGPPEGMVDMRERDIIFSRLLGKYTFTNEFIFSGHTSIPFLFFLFFEEPFRKTVMFCGSLTMGLCVLLSHNHYTVDVLAAFPMSYSIYVLSDRWYQRFIHPLFQETRSRLLAGNLRVKGAVLAARSRSHD
jgi:hypothetical protein